MTRAPGIGMHTSAARRAARAIAMAFLAAGASVGCNWGVRPETFPPARGPEGAAVTVFLAGGAAPLRGELFAADSSGIYVAGARVVRARWNRVGYVRIDRLRRNVRTEGVTPPPERMRELALVARFPQGLHGDLLARVLERSGQSTLDDVP